MVVVVVVVVDTMREDANVARRKSSQFGVVTTNHSE